MESSIELRLTEHIGNISLTFERMSCRLLIAPKNCTIAHAIVITGLEPLYLRYVAGYESEAEEEVA